jgi:hypothetical protein
VSVRGTSGRGCIPGEIVFQVQYEKIAGIQPERGRLVSVGEKIAVACRAVLLFEIVNGQIHFQDAVLAAKIFWLWNFASLGRAWARICAGLLGAQWLIRWKGQKAKTKNKARTDCQPQENGILAAMIQKDGFQDALTTCAKDSDTSIGIRMARLLGNGYRNVTAG